MLNLHTLFAELVVDDNSHAAQHQTVDYLRDRGWRCQIEYRAPDWNDGHGRFIDIMAFRDGVSLAIEIDRATPRRKSLRKLHDIEADCKVVLLRGGISGTVESIPVIALEVCRGV